MNKEIKEIKMRTRGNLEANIGEIARTAFSMLVIFVMLILPVETAYSLSISNIDVEVSDRYAVIKWQTDKAATTEVYYGNSTSLGSFKRTTILDTNHSMIITPLKNNTVYYFNATSVNGSEKEISTGTFTTTLTDTQAPFIDAIIPEYTRLTTLPFTVKTEPGTQVYVYVGADLSAFTTSNADGTASIAAVRLRVGTGKISPNAVRIVAIDPSGNRNELTKIVNVDTTPPGIIFNEPIQLKNAAASKTFALGQSSLTIKGDSDEPATMDISIDGNVAKRVNISSPWETVINFDDGDRDYVLNFYALDRAGNVFDESYVVTLDTQDLRIEDTNLGDLSPSYVLHRTVKGKVNKAGAVITVFVNNKTTSDALTFWGGVTSILSHPGFADIGGLGQVLSGEKLSYITTSKDDGTFEIEIQLDNSFALTEQQATSAGYQVGDSWDNNVIIVASDAVGRTQSVKKNIIYTRCGAGGFFTISAPVNSPLSIPEPVLKAGFGQFSMTMDIKWNGPTDKKDVSFVSRPTITVRQLSREERIGRYNLTIGQNLMKSAAIYPLSISTDTKQLYSLVTLNPTTHDFSIGSANKLPDLSTLELEFPLVLELQYRYLKPDGTQSDIIAQRKCIDVNIQVEPELTDFYNVTGLLKGSIGFVNGTINLIDSILPPLQNLQKTGLYACGIATGLYWFRLIGNKVNCFSSGVSGGDIRNALKSGDCSVTYSDETSKPTCSCADSKYETCCSDTVETLYFQTDWVNTLCDRIFCPSIPSLTQHETTYSDLIVKKKETATEGGPVQAGTTQCTTGNFPSVGCQSEFNRAWDKIILLDKLLPSVFTGASAWKLAAQKARLSGYEPTETGIDSVLDRAGAYAGDICSPDERNSAKIVTSKAINGVQRAFKIYTPAQTDAQKKSNEYPDVRVDYGEYFKVGEYDVKTQGDKITEQNKVTEDTYFSVIYEDISFNRATGECIDSKCDAAVSGYDEKATPSKQKLPAAVMSAITTRYSGKYVFTPTSDIISALRAGCLPALTGYLKTYRALLTHVKSCFETIVKEGKGSTAACQALLSEVVCDFVIDAISCAFNVLGKLGAQVGINEQVQGQISINPFAAISSAGEAVSESITGRYGETGAFQALFSENALVHSVCIGAFTGNFDFEGISEMLSETSIAPVDSTCVAFPATRRFVSSNPFMQGKTTYLYYAGGVLAAGADMQSVSLKLICSADNSCNAYGASSNPGGECDCFKLGQEKTLQVVSDSTSTRQGEVFDEAKYMPVQNQEFRYDKVRLEYTFRDNTGETITKKCEASLDEEGQIPSTCSFGASGFRCAFDLGDKGTARFLEQPQNNIPVNKVYMVGETLSLPARVEVTNPENADEAKYRKYIRFVITNQNGQKVTRPGESFIYPLDNGVNNLQTLPGFAIASSDFGQQVVEPVQIVKSVKSGGITMIKGSAVASGDSTYFIVSFPTEKTYACNVASDKDGDIIFGAEQQKPQALEGDATTGALIKCNNVQFRLSNFEQVTKGNIPESKKISAYTGTAFAVRYTTPSTAQQEACPSNTVNWHVQVSLLYAKDTDDVSSVSPSNDVVISGTEAQENSFTIQTLCSSTGLVQETPAVTLNTFSITPTTVKAGGSVTVNYAVSGTAKVSKLEIKLGSASLWSVANPTAAQFAGTLTLPLKDASGNALQTGSLRFLINDAEQKDKTQTITITK